MVLNPTSQSGMSDAGACLLAQSLATDLAPSLGMDLATTFLVGYGSGAHDALALAANGFKCAGVVASDPPVGDAPYGSNYAADVPLLIALPFEGLDTETFEAALNVAGVG